MIRRLLTALLVLLSPAALLAQSNQISESDPAQIAAGQNGGTISLYGTFSATTVYFCFYSGYGSTTPVSGTVDAGLDTASFSIPADTIQQIPPDAFTDGVQNSSIYAVASPASTCNGITDPAYTNTWPIQIGYPNVGSINTASLPQYNPNIAGTAPPTQLILTGNNFATGITAVTFTGSSSVSPVSFVVSSTSLRVAAPSALTNGASPMTVSVCNNGPTYSYCSNTFDEPITIDPLTANPGTLVATPNPGTTLDTYSLQATFGSASTAGLSTGLVTFTDGATTLGTAPLKLNAGQFAAAATTGQFTGDTQFSTPYTSLVADLNQDGLPDALLYTPNDTYDTYIHILPGSSLHGVFGTDQPIQVDLDLCFSGVTSVAVGDFNHDGYPDIAALCSGDGNSNILIYLNNGDGTFPSFENSSFPAGDSTLLATADLTKDGRIDLVAAGPTDYTYSNNGIYVFLNDGTGNFALTPSSPTIVPTQTGPWTQLSLTDLNNDAYPDVVLLDDGSYTGTSSVSVFQNDGAGNFPASPTYQHTFSGNYANAVFPSTLPGNSYPNLIVSYEGAPSGFSVFQNSGTPTINFSDVNDITLTNLQNIAVADFTGDGYPDVATFDGSQVQIYPADTTGQFSTPLAPFTTPVTNVTGIFATDINSDGYADLLTFTPYNPDTSQPDFIQSYITTGTATAMLTGLSFTAATHNLSAVTRGSYTLTSGTGTTSLDVTAAPDTVQVTYSPANPTYSPTPSQTLTATITTAALPYATGHVQFYDFSSVIGTATLTNSSTGPSGTISTASITVSLSAGTHSISAVYNSDGADLNYMANESPAVNITVTQATPTLTWTPPAAITYGTALGAAQLNATASVPGAFSYTPAAGTTLPAGPQTLQVTFTPTDTTDYTTATTSVPLTVNKATPTITWIPNPASILAGTALTSAQLNATSSTPGTLVYTPALGTILSSGTQTLSVAFTPTDTANYNNTIQTATLQVVALVLSSLSLPTTPLGSPATTLTLTGAGFSLDAVVYLGTTPVATTYVNSTTLTAPIPAAAFQTVQTLPVTVQNVKEGQTSNALSITVTAPPVSSTFTGPSTSTSGSQPNLTFQLSNPYPVDITGTLTLTFTPSAGLTDDPSIQFASGGRTMTFTIPANSTASPTIQLQTGSVEGSITVTLALTAGGTDVTPATVLPITITLPAAAPGLSGVAITRSGTTFNVVVEGFSNTRAVTQAIFHFTPASGASLATTDVTIDGTTLFGNWFSSDTSVPYGSTFTYTQTFNIDQDASVVGSITVTLVNGVGNSPTGTAQ